MIYHYNFNNGIICIHIAIGMYLLRAMDEIHAYMRTYTYGTFIPKL